ncbi:MAG: flagellar hook-length control protein FliK [Planctomycetes bacterium]|nr:flagellar hook-length control protein FliK [Planctomycetota bacterium]
MNTNLLTIDNMMFAGPAVAAPPAPKPNTFTNATRLSPAADDTPPPPNTLEPTTTDNTPFIARNEPVNKPAQDFRHRLRETVMSKTTQKAQDRTKSEKQDPASAIPSKTNPTQSPSAPEAPITPGALVKEAATKMEPKTGRQFAQLITDLKDGKSPPVTGQAAKSAQIKLLVTTDKGQLGLKTVLPETSKGQHGLKTVLSNTSEGTADTQPGQDKNTDKISISNSTVVPTKGPTNGENTKELMSDALVDNDSKTTTTNKGAATTDKSAIPGNEKTPALNTNFPPAQTKFTEPQSQPVGITPEKSTRLANKPSESKAAAPEILSESSGGSGKESLRAGNKLPDNPTAQELNITAVQVSTGQTKNRSSSTSNDSSNSDLEQILSHNNPQTPVTEQSPNSAEGAKSFNLPGQTSPGSVSADIGKQILESIHSSLSQKGQDQQITVRLNPPELGKVLIKFQEQDNQIIGLLEVSKTQTRIEIQQALPQIIRSLQDSGIQIKRLEVVLSEAEQPEHEALRDQSLHNGWGQQQDSTNSYMDGNNPDARGINEWLINNNSYENISELQEALVTDGINMLA